MLHGSQNWSGHGGEENNSLPLLEFEPLIFQPIAQHCTTELSHLHSTIIIFIINENVISLIG
jgi:hypothetical protein